MTKLSPTARGYLLIALCFIIALFQEAIVTLLLGD
jgi:hypothetical protein